MVPIGNHLLSVWEGITCHKIDLCPAWWLTENGVIFFKDNHQELTSFETIKWVIWFAMLLICNKIFSHQVANLIRVRKTLSARQQCWPESFCESGKFLRHAHYWLKNFRIIWKMSGCYTKYPYKSVRMIWKVFGQSKRCPDNLENLSGSSGKCPDDLESFLTI